MIDFSREGFAHVVGVVRVNGYRLIGFDQIEEQAPVAGKLCLLRHDVDACMDFAVEMAELEHELGVRSTFFVMLRSPLYNLMGRHGMQALQSLLRLGHDIGLHFDAGALRRREQSIEEAIGFEMAVLGDLAGRPVKAFSLHQPSVELIERRIDIPAIVNTYHPGHMAGFTYVSDSNRIWRGKDPLQLVESACERIHVLLHPIWWMCPHHEVEACWDAAIIRNFEIAQAQLIGTERAFGPQRKLSLRKNDSLPAKGNG